MQTLFSLVTCEVTYNDGSIKIKEVTSAEASIGMASMNYFGIIDYLKSDKNVDSVKIKDVYFFPTEDEYWKYLEINRS